MSSSAEKKTTALFKKYEAKYQTPLSIKHSFKNQVDQDLEKAILQKELILQFLVSNIQYVSRVSNILGRANIITSQLAL